MTVSSERIKDMIAETQEVDQINKEFYVKLHRRSLYLFLDQKDPQVKEFFRQIFQD